VIYVFMAAISLVFIFSFGPGSGGCKSAGLSASDTHAATVNGEAIPVRNFEQTYARVFREYQSRAGGQFTEELAQSIKLKENVLDQLIDRELLTQEAVKHGLSVSDRELAEQIHKIDAFKVGGVFNQERYMLLLERELVTPPAQFEDDLRRSMLAQKMMASLLAAAKVSEDEVRSEFIKEKDKVNLAYVRFIPSQFKEEAGKPAAAEIKEFVSANKAKVEESFKTNSYRYNKPRRVKARHILAKLEEGAPQADVDAARKRIEAVLEKVKAKDADFAALAKEHSEDPGSKEKGGDLGIFGPGTMDPKFQEVAFALKPGEVSGIVQTRFGFHVIKSEESFPEENKKLEEVQDEIASELLADESAKKVARKKAEDTLASAKAGKKLEELWPATKKEEDKGGFKFDMGGGKPEADETGPFAPSGEYVPKIGSAPEVVKVAFSLTEERRVPDSVLEVNGNFYVVALKSHERPDLKELEAKLDEWRDKARQKKANELVEGVLKSLKESAKVQKNEAVLASPRGPGGNAVDKG
jgi:peptidyl-prolyl cis-trans isomerase D